MVAPKLMACSTHDVRFPTSRELDGSDAMNPAPDYSAAYVILRGSDGSTGHGMTFTIGRGNEICCAAIEAIFELLKGREIEGLFADMGATWRLVTGDSQLRWTGPEKGVIHLAAAAVMNALWDMYGKRADKPVWRLIAEMEPADQVALVDWRYLADALPPEEARERLEDKAPGRAARVAEMEAEGYPAYTTSAGWLGYSDDKIRDLIRAALAQGWTHFKMKVGVSVEDDLRRARLIREEIGPDRFLMMDANQVWGVEEAIANMKRLAPYDPWWIEEPTSPDDVLGHARIAREIAPISVATGEHCHNAVMFKQFMQAQAIAVRAGGQLPPRRPERDPRRDADGREIRPARLSACRRRGPVRVDPAHEFRGLHLRLGEPRESGSGIRRPPARALRRSGADAERALRVAGPSGLFGGDEGREHRAP
jgi:L-fuconate dehydratase